MGNKGLYKKYIIQKVNGTEIDKNADYFVLRLDTDPYAREAIAFYAALIKKHNPELADDLLKKFASYAQGTYSNCNSGYCVWKEDRNYWIDRALKAERELRKLNKEG